MAIQNFPAALQPIIQQNFLEREFEDSMESALGFRAVAEREEFSNKIGETITKTKVGLKAPVTTPLSPSSNTGLDNGLTPSGWTVEQYTLTLAEYADTIDLNVVNNEVGIADQFVKNVRANTVQASQSLDRLARNALFNAYMGGNTRVRTTLGAAAATIAVDDIRGFMYVPVNGVMVPVNGTNTATVYVGSDSYTLVGVTADGTNVSTAFGGVSGTLTFSANVTVADGTAGNPVVHANASTILRPNGRTTTTGLQSTDLLTMGLLLDAVAQLRNNAVPTLNGYYNVYLDNKSARQVFADQDFKLLFQGQHAAQEFRQGRVIELLDCRFIPTTESPQQAMGAISVKRPIVCGADALVEGDFSGMGASVKGGEVGEIAMVDGIVQVVRPPLDRLQQVVSQSWYWIGGFVAPTDVTANQSIIPTASAAFNKRAIVLETA